MQLSETHGMLRLKGKLTYKIKNHMRRRSQVQHIRIMSWCCILKQTKALILYILKIIFLPFEAFE